LRAVALTSLSVARAGVNTILVALVDGYLGNVPVLPIAPVPPIIVAIAVAARVIVVPLPPVNPVAAGSVRPPLRLGGRGRNEGDTDEKAYGRKDLSRLSTEIFHLIQTSATDLAIAMPPVRQTLRLRVFARFFWCTIRLS